MITTITTVTTVTTVTVLGIGTAVSIAAAIALIAFLATRELAGAVVSGASTRIAKLATIGILPLLMAFAVIVTVRLFELI